MRARAGQNNGFLINTRHEYARMYNDCSVLENRHVSLLYTLLAQEPNADVFAGVRPSFHDLINPWQCNDDAMSSLAASIREGMHHHVVLDV